MNLLGAITISLVSAAGLADLVKLDAAVGDMLEGERGRKGLYRTIQEFDWGSAPTADKFSDLLLQNLKLVDDNPESGNVQAQRTAFELFDRTFTPAAAAKMKTAYKLNEDIRDDEPPLVLVLGPMVMKLALNAVYVDPGATSLDNKDGDLSAGIIVGGDVVDTSAPAEYVVTYTSTDKSGNSTTERRLVVVANV